MKQVIDNKRYDTMTATIIAHKRNKYLYKTFKGNFFLFVIVLGNRNQIKSLTRERAKEYYENMTKKVEWKAAFGEPRFNRTIVGSAMTRITKNGGVK